MSQVILLWSVLVTAAISDSWSGKVYNWLTLPAIVAGLGLATIEGSWYGLSMAILGLLLGGAVFLPGFCLGYLGGGDVKLMASVGAIAGPIFVLKAVLGTIIIGGGIALVILVYRKGILTVIKWYIETVRIFILRFFYPGCDFAYPESLQGGTFPFATSILLGSLLAHYVDVTGILY